MLATKSTNIQPQKFTKKDGNEPQPSFTNIASKPQSNTEQKIRSHTVAECESLPVTSLSNMNKPYYEEHVYDDLDSALSETLLLIQTMTNDEDQPIYDDAIIPMENKNQSANYKPTDVAQMNDTKLQNNDVMYSHLIPAEKKTSIPDAESPIYDDALPPTANNISLTADSCNGSPKKKPSKGIGYAEILAMKNTAQDDSEQMTLTRDSEAKITENDDVFQLPVSSSPNPKPKKRTRFLTSTSPPKVSPKPKPRRLTAPLKSEGEELSTSTQIEQIVATSSRKGEIKIMTDLPTAKYEQKKIETKPKPVQQIPEPKKPPYVNLELRTIHKKPPPSPPRKRSTLSTSSPGTSKKPVPPVAPKPKPKKN